MAEKWYVVRSNSASEYDDIPFDEREIWTLSKNPNEEGWTTDSGASGYGLTRRDAEFLAQAANEKIERQTYDINDWVLDV